MWSLFSRDPSKDFNYDVGELVDRLEEKSVWKLYAGKKKIAGDLVSVFGYDIKSGNDVQLEIVKSSQKRFKTLRHPNILTYLDSLESDKCFYLVTENVQPLRSYLTSLQATPEQKEIVISWGLHQITKALKFLNVDCGLIHNNVNVSSIMVTQAGEWKLGGLEFMCNFSESGTQYPVKILPTLEKYDPPEFKDRGKLKHSKRWSTDMWGLGCLIWEVFNTELSRSTALKELSKIPKGLSAQYCELLNVNPGNRPSPSEFIDRCRNNGGYMKNSLIDTLLFLEEIQIKDVNEKSRFFSNLTSQLDSLPSDMCKYKILPLLLNAFDFGNAGSAVLPSLFKLGKLLDADEYQKKIVPCVVKLFSSTDRATRARLLQQMDHFVDHLTPSVVNDQIFPQIANGFMDTNPVIREATVKSMLQLAPKLNYNNLNVELMKHFARLQARDDQGGIRTNTTICLGKISSTLHPQARQKMLVSAFGRAVRDPFPAARIAGILAFAATQQYYLIKDIAGRVIPILSSLTVDPEKSVRDHAFQTIKSFLGKLEKVSVDPSLIESLESEVNANASPTVADTAVSWAGWAVSSFTAKFYKSKDGSQGRIAGNNDTKSSPSGGQPQNPRVVVVATAEADSSGSPKRAMVDFQRASAYMQANKSSSTEDSSGGQSKPSLDSDHSDYADEEGGGWGDDWGEMDVSGSKSSIQPDPANKGMRVNAGGWDDFDETDEWNDTDRNGSNQQNIQSADFAPVNSDGGSGLVSVSSYNWDKSQETNNRDDFFSNASKFSSRKPATSETERKSGEATWDKESDANWDSWVDNGDDERKQHSKKQREERRLQRQQKLDEKKRSGGGVSNKLGAMKLTSNKDMTSLL